MKKQRWEESEKRREEEDQRRERVRIKKMQVREKVGKSRNTVFFQCFVAPDGRKVGSLKRRVRSHLARWEMKNCTLLWREAHVEVKMHTKDLMFGAFLEVEKVHAVVAQSTFQSEKCKKRTVLWKLSCWKKLRREAHFEVKMCRTLQCRSTFGS